MTSADGSISSLPYHEPDIVTILVLSSFLILLNAINWMLDRLVYCGLIGQILIGVAWGTPGASWLSADVQTAAVNLGYLGLILIVFEASDSSHPGGLSTNLSTLTSNLPLSLTVALIGISAPIALTFILPSLIPSIPIRPVQAFAAGAALCSTSLGTTFTVLTTSGLTESRLGVVLTSAAMIDDVVGLVMVQVIGSLGDPDFSAVTVVRPVGVSIAFAVVVPAVCWGVVRPLMKSGLDGRKKRDGDVSGLWKLLRTSQAVMTTHTLVLLAFVTASSYAGTSNLFAAYLAGACISWFDGLRGQAGKGATTSSSPDGAKGNPQAGTSSVVETDTEGCHQAELHTPEPSAPTSSSSEILETENASPPDPVPVSTSEDDSPGQTSSLPTTLPRPRGGPQNEVSDKYSNGRAIYSRYYHPAVTTILKPLFFASIGFSIPISRMFSPPVLWRGVVYALLMTFGKLLCGLCLVRFSRSSFAGVSTTKKKWAVLQSRLLERVKKADEKGATHKKNTTRETSAEKRALEVKRPLSIYPAAILGSAMVSRGEIGFLISAVAESNGIFGSGHEADQGGSELFLVVTWAILLCTIVGPMSVGLLVKRVKRLQIREREQRTGREDPLGIWGVVANAAS